MTGCSEVVPIVAWHAFPGLERFPGLDLEGQKWSAAAELAIWKNDQVLTKVQENL